ncbi:MAG: hypothetical protein JRN52_05650 [Nitrososphaerota archaeon]|nr:hypothetical protein [Nitrososphaerota archaeon]
MKDVKELLKDEERWKTICAKEPVTLRKVDGGKFIINTDGNHRIVALLESKSSEKTIFARLVDDLGGALPEYPLCGYGSSGWRLRFHRLRHMLGR